MKLIMNSLLSRYIWLRKIISLPIFIIVFWPHRSILPYEIVTRGIPNSPSYKLYFRDENGPISPFHDIPLFSDEQKKIYNMVVEIPRWTNAKMEINVKEPLNPLKQDIKNGSLRYVSNCFPHHGYIWNYGAIPQTWENPTSFDEHTGYKGDGDPIDIMEIGYKLPNCNASKSGYTLLLYHMSLHEIMQNSEMVANLPFNFIGQQYTVVARSVTVYNKDTFQYISQVAQRGEVLQVKILGTVALIDEGETDWKIFAIDVKDPLADQINDIADIDKFFPGLLKATIEWYKIYKIPDGKSENQFAFNGEAKSAEFAYKVIEETHHHWKSLVNKEIENDEICCVNVKLSNNSYTIPVSEAEQIIAKSPPLDKPSPIPAVVDKWHFITLKY